MKVLQKWLSQKYIHANRQPRRRNLFANHITVNSQGLAREAALASATRLVLVERNGFRTLHFQCPCGCSDIIAINLDPRVGPAWELRISQTRLSLRPSVWRTTGCKSHFVLSDDKVLWYSDKTQTSPDSWYKQFLAYLLSFWKRVTN